MKLLIMQYSPVSSSLFSLGPNIFPIVRLSQLLSCFLTTL